VFQQDFEILVCTPGSSFEYKPDRNTTKNQEPQRQASASKPLKHDNVLTVSTKRSVVKPGNGVNFSNNALQIRSICCILAPMIFNARNLFVLITTPLLTQCALRSAPPSQMVTGPFDSRGNYVEDWVDRPEKWYRPPGAGSPSESSASPSIASNPEPEPHIPLIHTDSPPEIRDPQSTVSYKPTSRPKTPTIVRHTVKRGDTLSGLAKRYGSSISKIQRANGISGSMIRLGQTLKIPK
jgi:nucleoid-associated protein YgaU